MSKEPGNKADFPVGSKVPPKKYRGFHSTAPGAIARLDDELLSDDYANKGFWAPIEFFQEIGGNVYFLEKYDPTKIPILFVHGAAGSPRNWRAFLEGIDRARYQPWFFYYPSGASIDSMSYLLMWKLGNLQAKYRFKELYVTAHSMGGLVVRSFLVNYGHFFPSITHFFSISTPWGGEELAELGVKYSPAVVPAWRDIQPGSVFIDSLFGKKLPPTVDHYLFFGHRGNRNILRPNNDEVVTLASQLDQRSQREAKMIYGFNEDHVSILSSQLVISQYNAILSDIYRETKAENKAPGNRLHVDFAFDFPKEQPRPGPVLLLRPVDKRGGEIWIQLNRGDTRREYGPFPSGEYEVSMIAPAFAPDPVTMLTSIDEGAVASVKFLMKPVGYLRGYVIKGEQSYVQAGKYRQRDTGVQIRSISLKGGGIHRTLTPLPGEAGGRGNYDPLIPSQEQGVNYPEYYLSGTDFTSNGIFCFFDLPAGEYELTIDATGYERYSRKCNVEPGQYKNTMVIELVKQPDSAN
jgi:pimeloyl-ACP methyl ester carboxylesterase